MNTNTTTRLFLAVLVRNIVVAQAIMTVEPFERKGVLLATETTVRSAMHLPIQETVLVKVLKEREINVGESIVEALHITEEGQTMTVKAPHASGKAVAALMHRIDRQQATARRHHADCGNYQNPSSGSSAKQVTDPNSKKGQKQAKKARLNNK